MKKLILISVLIAAALPALCDGTGTLIAWPGWTASSTEDIYLGHKHTSFPLTYLFDNNPATAWVFSGTGKHLECMETGYAITLIRDEDRKPVTVDSIWIMNGYNKSRELFLRNNRITELKLYVNEKLLKTVELADSMGWHKISIPRQPVREVKLEFTDFRKGRDDDVCVSEIALYDRGRKIDLRMPGVVEYTKGDGDCGCGQEYRIIDRTGKRLADYDRESPYVWSPSGRFLASVENMKLQVMDATTGKFVARRTVSADKRDDLSRIDRWKGEHTLVVSMERYIPQKTGPDQYKTVYRTKTFRVPG